MEEEFQLMQLVNPADSEATLKEVLDVSALMNPDFQRVIFTNVFSDIKRLFNGLYPDCHACNIEYHDFDHTCAVMLAMSRLMHGASLFRNRWGIDADLYRKEIERNIDYIRSVFSRHPDDYIRQLKRGKNARPWNRNRQMTQLLTSLTASVKPMPCLVTPTRQSFSSSPAA